MECIELGDLSRHLSDIEIEADKQSITRQMLRVLVYMHMEGIVHRDLKPEVVPIQTPYTLSTNGHQMH